MKKKTVEEFKKEFYELTNNDYELLSNYETAIKKVKVKHKECGNEYEVTPNTFLTGRRCPYCRWIETARKESISQEVAEDRIKNISDGEFVLVSKINGTSNKVTVECIKCGKCEIGDLINFCDGLDLQVFIIPGGSFVKKIIKFFLKE